MQCTCLSEQGSSLLLGRQRHRPGQQPLQLLACHAREPLSAQSISVPLQSLLLCTTASMSAQGLGRALHAGWQAALGSTCCVLLHVMLSSLGQGMAPASCSALRGIASAQSATCILPDQTNTACKAQADIVQAYGERKA